MVLSGSYVHSAVRFRSIIFSSTRSYNRQEKGRKIESNTGFQEKRRQADSQPHSVARIPWTEAPRYDQFLEQCHHRAYHFERHGDYPDLQGLWRVPVRAHPATLDSPWFPLQPNISQPTQEICRTPRTLRKDWEKYENWSIFLVLY